MATHLRGEAGDRQIEGAKVGLAHVIGLGSACGVHILEKRRPEHIAGRGPAVTSSPTSPVYDTIGRGYTAHRRADRRWEAVVAEQIATPRAS